MKNGETLRCSLNSKATCGRFLEAGDQELKRNWALSWFPQPPAILPVNPTSPVLGERETGESSLKQRG